MGTATRAKRSPLGEESHYSMLDRTGRFMTLLPDWDSLKLHSGCQDLVLQQVVIRKSVCLKLSSMKVKMNCCSLMEYTLACSIHMFVCVCGWEYCTGHTAWTSVCKQIWWEGDVKAVHIIFCPLNSSIEAAFVVLRSGIRSLVFIHFVSLFSLFKSRLKLSHYGQRSGI